MFIWNFLDKYVYGNAFQIVLFCYLLLAYVNVRKKDSAHVCGIYYCDNLFMYD